MKKIEFKGLKTVWCFSLGIRFVDYCRAGSGEEHQIAPSQLQTDFKCKKSINIKISLLARHKVRREKSCLPFQLKAVKTFV